MHQLIKLENRIYRILHIKISKIEKCEMQNAKQNSKEPEQLLNLWHLLASLCCF